MSNQSRDRGSFLKAKFKRGVATKKRRKRKSGVEEEDHHYRFYKEREEEEAEFKKRRSLSFTVDFTPTVRSVANLDPYDLDLDL